MSTTEASPPSPPAAPTGGDCHQASSPGVTGSRSISALRGCSGGSANGKGKASGSDLVSNLLVANPADEVTDTAGQTDSNPTVAMGSTSPPTTPNLQQRPRPSKAPLSRYAVVAYGSGHMLNDLTSACWFTYLLIFLTDIGLSPQQAAVVMMSGQLADAVATLIAGRLIDSFGHFKAWHFGGSVLVAVSFTSVFGGCLVCAVIGDDSTRVQTLSYSIFAAIFNVGWAFTQVSHMSMVNCLTANPSSRVALNSCRNAFTMVANLSLYGVAFLAFFFLPSNSALLVKAQFRWIAMGAVGLGLLFLNAFYCGVPEPEMHRKVQRVQRTKRGAGNGETVPAAAPCNAASGQRQSYSSSSSSSSWTFWFTQVAYYQVAAVYTLTRLVCNVSQALLPFFVVYDLGMRDFAKAAVPGGVYVCSLLMSVVLQELHWSARRLKLSYAAGAVLWLLGSACVFLMDYRQHAMVYLVAALMGTASALILVAATSMEGVLVGHRLEGCAFVYGSLSFLDKVSCGIALYAIEAANEPGIFCGSVGPTCPRSMVRWVLSVLPTVCATAAAVIAALTVLDESDGHHGTIVRVDVTHQSSKDRETSVTSSGLRDPLLHHVDDHV